MWIRALVAATALATFVLTAVLVLPAESQQAAARSGDRFDLIDTRPVPPGFFDDGPQVARAQVHEAYEAAIARSPDHKADRRRHARDDADETRGEALQTLREEFPDVADSVPWDPMRLEPGDEVTGYPSDYAARVDTDDHGTQLVTSMLPLRSRVGSGELRPVDLEMREGEETFRPANPLVKTVIEKDFDEGIAFPEQGYRIRLSGAGDTDVPMEVDDKVFVGNLGEDLDALIVPTPTGASTTLQVRSPDAPEALAYQFQLRDGQSLRPKLGDQGEMGLAAVEVIDGSEPIALLPMPGAVDADGRDVPVRMTLESDDKVVLTFPHHGEDFRYPLAVDPIVDNYQVDGFGNRTGGNDPFLGWQFFGNSNNNTTVRLDPRSTDSTALGSIRGNSIFGNGLYALVDRANAYHRGGTLGQWVWTAPGRSFIRRADFGYVTHISNRSCIIEGVFSFNRPGGANWEPGRWEHPPEQATRSGTSPWFGFQGPGNANSCEQFDNNYKAHHVNDPPTPGNQMVFTWLLNSGQEVLRSNGGAYLYGASIWLDDAEIPTLGPTVSSHALPGQSTPTTGLPTGWIKEGLIRVAADASDPGLGVKQMTVGGPGSDGLPEFFRNNYPCSGDRSSRCPNFWPASNNAVNFSTETLREGVLPMTLYATDALGKNSNVAGLTLRIDRTTPEVQLPEIGEAEEDPEPEVYVAVDEQSFTLQADVTDALSGVELVRLRDSRGDLVDSKTVPCPGSCPTSPATLALQGPVSALSETERYTVEAVDAADNISVLPVHLVADREPPPAPTELGLRAYEAGSASVGWEVEEDPDLPSGLPGSGVSRSEYRFKRALQPFTGWIGTEDNQFEIESGLLGESVDVEVRQVDAAGNAGPPAAASIVLRSVLDPPPEPQPSGGNNVIQLTKSFEIRTLGVVPLAGAAVVLRDLSSGETFETETGPDGEAEFRNVPDGSYDVETDNGQTAQRASVAGGVIKRIAARRGYNVTDEEIEFCTDNRKQQFACFYFFQDAEDSEHFAERLYTEPEPRSENTRANAFKHAFWVAKMVRSLAFDSGYDSGDYPLALEFASAHEADTRKSGELGARRTTAMDDHNNRVGYRHAVRNSPDNRGKKHNDLFFCNTLRARMQLAVLGRFRPRSAIFARSVSAERPIFLRRTHSVTGRLVRLISKSAYSNGQPCVTPR